MAANQSSERAHDPVCGMSVAPTHARGGSFAYQGTHYFFCGPKCRQRFEHDPTQFLSARASPVPAAAPSPAITTPARVWVCPMDPEVRESKPGPCPKCGMALEPEQPTAEAEDNPELRDMSRRLWIAASLSAPLFLISMAGMLPGHALAHLLQKRSLGLLELALASPVCLWAGLPFLERALSSLKNRSLNMFTLIGIGVSVAYGYSLFALLAPGLFPDSMRTEHGSLGLYFEAAAVIVTLALLGQVLELRARSRTGAAIRQLLELAPQSARRLDADGQERDVPVESLRVGDRLRILPGAKLATDGTVLSGTSTVDESMITGEPLSVSKKVGDSVIGGTLNGTGSLLIQAEKVGSETLLSRIVGLVSEAQRTRAPIQKLVDRVSGYFVPGVVLAALATFVVWFAAGPEPRLAHAIVSAVAVLIVACPCALGLATPLSILVATGRGANAGVLFKNAEAIELLGRIDTLVFDKTGTLTEGKPRLMTIACAPTFEEASLLRFAASLETQSEHPLAQAMLEAAAARGIATAELSSFESLTGRGVRGVVGGQRIALGNRALLEAETKSAELAELAGSASELEARGQTVMFLSVDGKLAGLLSIADPIKAGTAAALQALRREGLQIVMLTGDARSTADAVARQLDIHEVIAEVLPDQKAAAIEQLQAKGRVVAMAGDGINDAPALARAEVGIAMGTGTDIAIESAGITLIKGDLAGILRARAISRLALANIRQNLYFAFGYNALGIPIAAGVLYPVLGLLMSPMLAAAAMSLSSVSVIMNALRLRSARL